MVKISAVLVNTISDSPVFLLKNASRFGKCKSYSHFFSKNISVHAIFNDQSFNDTLTNNIASFEQLGPGVAKKDKTKSDTILLHRDLIYLVHVYYVDFLPFITRDVVVSVFFFSTHQTNLN